MLIKGDAHLAGSAGSDVIYAVREQEPFKKGSSTAIRGLFFGDYGSTCNWIVRADSKLYTIPDLKGKRCMFDRPGHALYQDNWAAVLQAYGMTEKDIILMPALGQRDAAIALKEGRCDAFFHHGSAPLPGVLEIEPTTPVRPLPLSDEAIANLLKKCPWVMVEILKAGTYKGQEKDIKWTAALAGTMVRKDLPDDLVYAIAKAVDEHIGELRVMHPAFKNYTIKGLANDPYGPYHAGAFKYYTEKGYLTAESIVKHKAFLSEIGQTN